MIENNIVNNFLSTYDNEENKSIEDKIVYIDPHRIREFGGADRKQRFSFSQEVVDEIVESAKVLGIQTPATVRVDPDNLADYEMISGRHRLRAALKLGIKLPCIIKDCDDIEASAIMAVTNQQREKKTVMEKAWTYRLAYEHIRRRQGERTDLTCAQNGHKANNENGGQSDHKLVEENGAQNGHRLERGKKSIEILAENSEDSKNTIKRLIRLTYLIEPLAQLINANKKKQFPMMAAVEVSYLTDKEQGHIQSIIEIEKMNLSVEAAKEIRRLSKEAKEEANAELTADEIYKIMKEDNKKETGEVKDKKKNLTFSIPSELVDLFPKKADTKAKREEILLKLLTKYAGELEELIEE